MEDVCLITTYLTDDHNMVDFRFCNINGNRNYDFEFEGGDMLGIKISEFEKLIEPYGFEKIFCSTFIHRRVLDKFMLELKIRNSDVYLVLTNSEQSAKNDQIFNATSELSNDGIKEILKRFLKRGIYIHCKKSASYSLYILWQEYFEKFKEEHPGVYLQFVVNNPELVED